MQVIDYAPIITFFGYSAPKSDVAALAMIKKAFRTSPSMKFKQIELIDIKGDAIKENYKDFIYKESRVNAYTNFYDTYLAHNPRRSCEVLYSNTMMCSPYSLADRYGKPLLIKEPTEDSQPYKELFYMVNEIDPNSIYPLRKKQFHLS